MHLFGVLGEEKKLLLLKRPGEKFPRERERRKGANDEGRENEYTNFLGRILKDDVASGKKKLSEGFFSMVKHHALCKFSVKCSLL